AFSSFPRPLPVALATFECSRVFQGPDRRAPASGSRRVQRRLNVAGSPKEQMALLRLQQVGIRVPWPPFSRPFMSLALYRASYCSCPTSTDACPYLRGGRLVSTFAAQAIESFGRMIDCHGS